MDMTEHTQRLTDVEKCGDPLQMALIKMAETQNNGGSGRGGCQVCKVVYNSPNLPKSLHFHLSYGIWWGLFLAYMH